MIRRLRRSIDLNRKGQRGTATIEFGVLMSFFLVPLMFGVLEASEAMTVNRRVASAVNTLADLTAQSESLNESELSALMDAAISILDPQSTSAVTATVTSVALIDDAPQVRWSMDRDKIRPYDKGDEFLGLEDEQTLDSGASLIVVDFEYDHNLMFTYFFDPAITFKRKSIRYPRLVDRVELCTDDDPMDCDV